VRIVNGEFDFERVDAEVRQAALNLTGADPAVIAAESDRLRALAEQIDDEVWRRRAVSRAERLPRLAAGPRGGSSPEFRAAEQLVAQGMSLQTPVPERLAELRRLSEQVGVLANQAPALESGPILRMNNTLNRLISLLETTHDQ
jgi:hypothetical protein